MKNLMNTKKKYEHMEKVKLSERYRINGELSSGDERALKEYKRGIEFMKKSDEYDTKNYTFYYDFKEHLAMYERRGLRYFKKAAKAYKRSAELGNDLAMMNYALYLYAFEKDSKEALKWFFAASDVGLAVADYQLSAFYKKGCCGFEINEEKADFYYQQYKKRCESDERQLILAYDLDDDCEPIGVSYMFAWFSGFSSPLIHDTPDALPSKWRIEAYK